MQILNFFFIRTNFMITFLTFDLEIIQSFLTLCKHFSVINNHSLVCSYKKNVCWWVLINRTSVPFYAPTILVSRCFFCIYGVLKWKICSASMNSIYHFLYTTVNITIYNRYHKCMFVRWENTILVCKFFR